MKGKQIDAFPSFLNSKSMHEKQKCGESRLFATQKYTQSHFVSFGYSLCACKKTLRLEIAALNFQEHSVSL